MDHTPTVIRTERGLTIAGTRTTLYSIMDCIVANWPPKLIQDRFDLTDQQIADILEYIDAHRAEVDAEYQLILSQAEDTRHYWETYNRERFAAIANLPPKPEHAVIRAKLAQAKAKRQQS